MARPSGRELAHDRQAAAHPVAGLPLCRAAADWHARGDQGRAARAPRGVLPEMVPAGSDGGRGGRRSRPCRGREAGARALRQHPASVDAGGDRGPHRALTRRDALQRGHRSGIAGLDGDAQLQERAAGAADGRRLSRGPGAAARERDDQPAPARDCPPARRAVRGRRSRRRQLRTHARAVRDWRRRAGERIGGRARSDRARGPARAAVRLQRRGARSGAARAGRRLRARLQRTRDQREPELRRRVRPPLPGWGSDSRHRVRIPHRLHLSARRHAGRSVEGRSRVHHRREPGGAGGRAGEEGRPGADSGQPQGRDRARQRGQGGAVGGRHGRPHAGEESAGGRQGHGHAARSPSWASRS